MTFSKQDIRDIRALAQKEIVLAEYSKAKDKLKQRIVSLRVQVTDMNHHLELISGTNSEKVLLKDIKNHEELIDIILGQIVDIDKRVKLVEDHEV